MLFKNKTNKSGLVGVDIGSSSVKAVELQGKFNNLQLVNLGYENLQPDSIVDGQIMELNGVANVIANIFREQQIKTDKVVAGVSGHSVIVKSVVVPKMSEAELEESIEWHAEEYIPFEIGDVSLDYQITGESDDGLQVLLAACKRDKIANLRQAIQLAGKHPSIVDVESFALQNCYEVNYSPVPGEIVALLNVGAATMNINIMNGAQSVFTRDVTVGGNQYTALLQKELGLSLGDAEAVKRGMPLPPECADRDIELIMRTVSEILALEIQKTFDFYRATAAEGEGNVNQLLLAGGGSKLTGLREFLTERFEMPVEWLDPFRNIKVDARKFDPDYMREVLPEMVIAVGLALRGVDAK
jgi:type IV pilus assembly protein PilM